jgi:FtsZ-interacting cell division protein ZipA
MKKIKYFIIAIIILLFFACGNNMTEKEKATNDSIVDANLAKIKKDDSLSQIHDANVQAKTTVIDDKQAYANIKEFAKREYPSDYDMQQFVYNKQVSAYNYMKTVTDTELKNFAIGEYSEDYDMQKFVYEKQLAAKKFMSTVTDAELKNIAVSEYPHDYDMQKFVYEKQMKAKNAMK